MSGSSDKSRKTPDFKVFIRTPQGKYLAQDGNGLFFTEDRSAAIVLNYDADQVPMQLEALCKSHNIKLAADPVPLDEIYESCDRCKELYMPFMTYYDGSRFLCPDCRSIASRIQGCDRPGRV